MISDNWINFYEGYMSRLSDSELPETSEEAENTFWEYAETVNPKSTLFTPLCSFGLNEIFVELMRRSNGGEPLHPATQGFALLLTYRYENQDLRELLFEEHVITLSDKRQQYAKRSGENTPHLRVAYNVES